MARSKRQSVECRKILGVFSEWEVLTKKLDWKYLSPGSQFGLFFSNFLARFSSQIRTTPSGKNYDRRRQ